MFQKNNDYIQDLRTKIFVMEERLSTIGEKVSNNSKQIQESESAIDKLQSSMQSLEVDVNHIKYGVESIQNNAFFKLTKDIDTRTIITWICIIFSAASTPGVIGTYFVKTSESEHIELDSEELKRLIDTVQNTE